MPTSLFAPFESRTPSHIVLQVTVPYHYEYLNLKDVKADCFDNAPKVLPQYVVGRIVGVTIPAEALVPTGECLSSEAGISCRQALPRASRATPLYEIEEFSRSARSCRCSCFATLWYISSAWEPEKCIFSLCCGITTMVLAL